MPTAVIGLGSNLKQPLQQLRVALQHLSKTPHLKIQAYSPIYLSHSLLVGQPPYLNGAVRIETLLPPQQLLTRLKAIERNMGRIPAPKWSARLIDLDLLCYDKVVLDEPDLTLPHPELLNRAFALQPLLDVLPHYDAPGVAEAMSTLDSSLKILPHLLEGPEIVGILNITPDSFRDGGKYTEADKALAQAILLFDQGADVIDIGAESTRPRVAELIDSETEWQRLRPILQALHAHWKNIEHRPLISIDTRHAATIEKCLPHGIDWINDQSQAEFDKMTPFLKRLPLKYVAMHHCGLPPHPDRLITDAPFTVLRRFKQEWQARFDQHQLRENQLILDPGIGFGKTPAQYLEIFKAFDTLSQGETPWLIGHSCKSFLKHLFPERDITESATAVISGFLANQGVRYLRVHEPEPNIAAIQLHRCLCFKKESIARAV